MNSKSIYFLHANICKALLFLLYFAATVPVFAQNDSAKIQLPANDSITYTCSMHPEIISNKPGKCPKCGMDLIQKNSSSTEHKMNMMMCPMHGMMGMDHKHDEGKNEKKGKTNGMGMGMMMGGMMLVMMMVMLIIIGSR